MRGTTRKFRFTPAFPYTTLEIHDTMVFVICFSLFTQKMGEGGAHGRNPPEGTETVST